MALFFRVFPWDTNAPEGARFSPSYIPPTTGSGRFDLPVAATLRHRRIKPDRIASRRRRRTQAIAASIWDSGNIGLRWWSSFWGDWHGVVLFTERIGQSLRFGAPQEIHTDTPALYKAATALGMSTDTLRSHATRN